MAGSEQLQTPASPSGSPAGSIPRSPAARRLRSVRWLNPRLLLGVVLVLAAVVAGARVIGAADDTVTVWAATGDLSAGVKLTDADVVAVEVKLESGTSKYLAADEPPNGVVLVRDVAEGELIPAAAIGESTDLVSLALSVPANQLPISAARGDRISIYASVDSTTSVGESPSSAMVVEAVTLTEISGRSDGALSTGSAELQIVVAVPQCAVQQILDDSSGKTLTVVVLDPAVPAAELC